MEAESFNVAVVRGACSSPPELRVLPSDQRLAQPIKARLIAQFGKPGPAQQRTQYRVTERGPVEFAEVLVAAGMAQKQGIADVI